MRHWLVEQLMIMMLMHLGQGERQTLMHNWTMLVKELIERKGLTCNLYK
jgi:hypothetical protein